MGCFLVWAITNEAARNIHIQIFVHKSSFLWDKRPGVQLPASALMASVVSSRNCPAEAFYIPSGGAGEIRVFTSSPAFGVTTVFILAALIGVYCHRIRVLICISLRTGDAEHLFIGFSAISISSLVKCFFTA